jgi:hypothetical protein
MSPKKESNGAANKNVEAWGALIQFGQPIGVISIVSACTPTLNKNCRNDLDAVMLSVPLALCCVAAVINSRVDNPMLMLKNYVYYFLHGLFISIGLFMAGPLEPFFIQLNDGWFKNTFTGNVLHPTFGFGLRMYLVAHTLQLLFGKHLYDLLF